ncbi:MAG: polyphosphate polymerase domain-containing protein [Lachnospiraceae bacterium]|nr:polyphosphate polymerase domain-containing protein [Lachnospiraceae bacterium]
MSKYRHEYKYVLNHAQAVVLEKLVSGLLQADSHANEKGVYLIKSLYFDDYANSCYYENENGTDPRSKFRIRFYNNNTQKIKLEKKSKVRGMTRKESCSLTLAECQQMMHGKIPETNTQMSKIKISLFTQMRLKNMQPKVIVIYERKPFIYQAGNVRITFDRNICSSNLVEHFLEENIPVRQILSVGESIMEVKWDEFLPKYIKDFLQLGQLQWSSFSKYYLCRKYSSNGGLKL